MPYTDQQIKEYAYKLEAKGAPSSVIRDFVAKAKAEQTQAMNVNKTQLSSIRQRAIERKAEAKRRGVPLEQVMYEKLPATTQAKLRPGREAAQKAQSFGNQALGFAKDLAGNLLTAGVGGVSKVGEMGLNDLSVLSNAMAEGTKYAPIGAPLGGLSPILQQAAPAFKNTSKNLSNLTENYANAMNQYVRGQNADPFARGGGNFAGTTVGLAAPTAVGSKVRTGIEASSFLPKVPKTLKSISGLGAESAIGTTGYSAGERGELPTTKELAIGLGTDALFGGLGGIAKKARPWLYKLGVTPEVMGNPLTAHMKQKAVANEASKLGLVGSKNAVNRRARKLIAKAGSALEKLVKNSKKSFSKDELVNSAVERATKLENLGDLDGAKRIMKFVNDFRKGKDTITAKQLLSFKRQAAETILPALKKGDVGSLTAAAKKQFWSEVYDNASRLLDSISKDVSKYNRQMSVAYSVGVPTGKELLKSPTALALTSLQKVPGSTWATTWASKALGSLEKASNPAIRQLARTSELKSPGSVSKPAAALGLLGGLGAVNTVKGAFNLLGRLFGGNKNNNEGGYNYNQ